MSELALICSVRNYRSPSRHWRLTFRVGDHQLSTWSPKKKQKEKNEKLEQSQFLALRRADRERAFFLSFFRFGLIENDTQIAKLPPVTRMRGATVQSCVAGAFHTCGRKIEKQRDKTTPCHNTQLESRFTFLALLRRERRRTDPDRTFFLSVSVRSSARRPHGLRNSHLSRACEVLQHYVFLATSLSTRVVEKTKRHNSGTILSQKRRADRRHELPSVWVSIVCKARIAKLSPVTCMRRCYSVQRRCLQAGAIRQSPA